MLKSIPALVLAALVSVGAAHAASQKDVAEVTAMVTDKTIPMLSRVTSTSDGEHMGDTIAFVYKGMRYTFYKSGAPITEGDPNSAWLSVWVRKDGTYGQETLDTFSDHGFDGSVDFGIDGKKVKYFNIGNDSSEKPQGLEFQPFWQKKYDAAIRAALEYKRSRK